MKETIPGQTWAASNTNWWRGFSTAQSIYYEEERIVSFFSAWFLKEAKVSGTSSWPVPWLLLRYSPEIRVIFHFDYSKIERKPFLRRSEIPFMKIREKKVQPQEQTKNNDDLSLALNKSKVKYVTEY